MNDRQIEDMLRRSWQPKPPEGMRDRVLRNARAEMSKLKPGRTPGISRWKLALAGLGITVFISLLVIDGEQQSSIDKMTSIEAPTGSVVYLASAPRMRNLEIERDRLMKELINEAEKGHVGERDQL